MYMNTWICFGGDVTDYVLKNFLYTAIAVMDTRALGLSHAGILASPKTLGYGSLDMARAAFG
jgi:hypothetical protein